MSAAIAILGRVHFRSFYRLFLLQGVLAPLGDIATSFMGGDPFLQH